MAPLLVLQKTIGFLFVPVGFIWMALLFATFWLWKRLGARPAFPLFLVTLLYTLVGNVHISHALMRSLEQKVESRLLPADAPFDAAFVFGGGTELDPFGEPQVASSGDRVVFAARLYHAGRVKHLVASGVSSDDPTKPRNLGEETRTIWLGLGVPDSAIHVVSNPCRVTREEITAFKDLQQTNAWTRVALVSSAWHLPRIMQLAHRADFQGVPVGCDWRGRRHVFEFQDCVPQGAAFWRSNVALWEYLGMLGRR